jgi:hypothetical protein
MYQQCTVTIIGPVSLHADWDKTMVSGLQVFSRFKITHLKATRITESGFLDTADFFAITWLGMSS